MSTSSPDPNCEQKRNRSIKLAVITSLMSKLGTAALQLISMPFAARALGKEEFGLYATISMTITLIVLLELGVGPAVVQGISNANAKGDKDGERRYYGTSLAMITVFTLIGAAILATVISLVPITTLFGPEYAGLEAPLMKGIWVGLGLFIFELILSHSDRAREGYMETNITNTYLGIGNIIAAVLVGVGVLFVPEVWFLLLAVFGMNVIMKTVNMAALLKKRPYLLPGPGTFSKSAFNHVLKDGLAFSVSYALTIIVEFNFCALLIGRLIGPGEVALFQVFVSITVALNGIIVMLTTPIWPAVVDAFVKGDHPWIVKTTQKLYGFVMFVAFGALIGSALFGPWFLPKWYGEEFQGSTWLFAAWGIFFVANAWRRANHVVVVGLGMVARSAKYTLVECTLAASAAYAGLLLAGVPGLWCGLAIAIFSVSGWAYPWMFWSKIKNAQKTPDAPAESPSAAAQAQS